MELSQDISGRQSVKRRKGKNLNCGNSIPQNALDIIEARQQPENSETYFEVKTESFVFKFLKPLGNIIACFFIATKLTHGHLLELFVAPMMSLQSFSAL